MSDSEDEDTPDCPVCNEVADADILASGGLVITGLKALHEGDWATDQVIATTATPYDFHFCLTVLYNLLQQVGYATGQSMTDYLSTARADINAFTLRAI